MLKLFNFFSIFILFSVSVYANQSFVGQKSDTQLIQAVKAGNKKTVKKLLKSGISVNSLGQDHKTALDLAVESGYVKIAIYLIEYGGKVTSVENQIALQSLLHEYSQRYKFISRILAIVTCILAIPCVALVAAAAMAQCGLVSAIFVIAAIVDVASILWLDFFAERYEDYSRKNLLLKVVSF